MKVVRFSQHVYGTKHWVGCKKKHGGVTASDRRSQEVSSDEELEAHTNSRPRGDRLTADQNDNIDDGVPRPSTAPRQTNPLTGGRPNVERAPLQAVLVSAEDGDGTPLSTRQSDFDNSAVMSDSTCGVLDVNLEPQHEDVQAQEQELGGVPNMKHGDVDGALPGGGLVNLGRPELAPHADQHATAPGGAPGHVRFR